MNQVRIATASRKGGVGKTTLAVSLASVIASRGSRTIVIDLDPQSNAAFFLGSDPAARGTAELVLAEPVEPLATIQERLFVLPGGMRLHDQSVTRLGRNALAESLAQLSDFEAIVFDCPPGHENLERMAMAAATNALLVANAHPVAFLGIRQVLNDLEFARETARMTPSRIAVILNQIDCRRALDKAVEDAAERSWPSLTRMSVRQDSRLAQITANRAPLMTLPASQRGPALSDLERIADWSQR